MRTLCIISQNWHGTMKTETTEVKHTKVGALPATPIRHDMHNIRRYIAKQTLPHKGRHAGLPLHGHTNTAIAKPSIGVTALGALQATPLLLREIGWSNNVLIMESYGFEF